MSAQVDNYFSAFDNSFFGVADTCRESNKGVCFQCSTAVACSDVPPFYDEQAYDDENGRLLCSTCHTFNNSLRQLETPTWDKKDHAHSSSASQSTGRSTTSSQSSSASASSTSTLSSSSKNAKRRKRTADGIPSPTTVVAGEVSASPRPKKKKVQRELTHEELMAALANSGDNPNCALEKFTVPQIQDMLRKHKASTKGSKPQLIQRLVRYTSMWEQQGREDVVKRGPPTPSPPPPSSINNIGAPMTHTTTSGTPMPVASSSQQVHPHPIQSSPQPPMPQPLPLQQQPAPLQQPPLQQPMQQHIPPHHAPHPSTMPSPAPHPHAQHLPSYQSPDHHLIWQQQLLQQHIYQQQFYQHVVQVQMHQSDS